MKREFIQNITEELFKVNKGRVDAKIFLDMIEDIVVYFNDSEEEEYASSQQYVRIRELFREYIVEDWAVADFNCKNIEN